jgi:hypothetical protein
MFQKQSEIFPRRIETLSVQIYLQKAVYSFLDYLYKMSRGRPRKYRTKRESKAAKKAHTKLFVTSTITLIKAGMKGRKQKGFVNQQVPLKFLNWKSLRTCVVNLTRNRVKYRVRVHGTLLITVNLKGLRPLRLAFHRQSRQDKSLLNNWKPRCFMHPWA